MRREVRISALGPGGGLAAGDYFRFLGNIIKSGAMRAGPVESRPGTPGEVSGLKSDGSMEGEGGMEGGGYW